MFVSNRLIAMTEFSKSFCKFENLLNGKINEQSFSIPHPRFIFESEWGSDIHISE